MSSNINTAKNQTLIDDLNRTASTTTPLDPVALIKTCADQFGESKLTFASSLGAEDQLLTHIIRSQFPDINIFTIDTGRLPQETFDVMHETMALYGFSYDVLFPDAGDVSQLVQEHGPNLFYRSVDLRKECCRIRKVVPLQKKLKNFSAWITGLRRAQGMTRIETQAIEWDEANDLVKINPLVDWSEEDVWKFIRSNQIPTNKLHAKGYPSIGCAPCTRAVAPGGDPRSGRWWWEDEAEKKECGLHLKPNK